MFFFLLVRGSLLSAIDVPVPVDLHVDLVSLSVVVGQVIAAAGARLTFSEKFNLPFGLLAILHFLL